MNEYDKMYSPVKEEEEREKTRSVESQLSHDEVTQKTKYGIDNRTIYGGTISKVRVGKYFDTITEFIEKDNSSITYALSKSGDYIGNLKAANRLVKKYGITTFVKIHDSSCVCSIGYSPEKKKWYGWSHRAIYGFKVGDVVKKGDLTSEYIPVGFKAKTSFDAKIMAEAFSSSVS